MNSLESTKPTAMMWHKRQTLTDLQRQKPFFLQLDTYRFLQHCGPASDDNLNYRDKKELNYWFNLDPVKYYEDLLVKKKVLKFKDIKKNKFEMKKVIKKIFDKSENTQLPKPNLASKYVYKN